MTYHCGIGPGMRLLGVEPRDPYVQCDGPGCTARVILDGLAPAWFLNGKPPRGWRGTRLETPEGRIIRRDYCPKHKDLLAREDPEGTERGRTILTAPIVGRTTLYAGPADAHVDTWTGTRTKLREP